MPENWTLRRRITLSGREISYDVLGFGPPLLLIHGTPTNSYIWCNVALRFADRFSVYTFDLLGFGQSEHGEGLDVSIPNQARLLAELVETLDLEAPSVAGHGIGGAIELRAHLLEGVLFGCVALVDSRRRATLEHPDDETPQRPPRRIRDHAHRDLRSRHSLTLAHCNPPPDGRTYAGNLPKPVEG